MKTKKEQNTVKDEAAENELCKLSDEEMKQVTGGGLKSIDSPDLDPGTGSGGPTTTFFT